MSIEIAQEGHLELIIHHASISISVVEKKNVLKRSFFAKTAAFLSLFSLETFLF